MRHIGIENESREMAALYSLGALGQHEARAFEEHLATGCDACAGELEEFAKVVPALGLSAPAVEPPREARGKLFSRIAVESDASTNHDKNALPQATGQLDFLIVRSDEGEWMKTADAGVAIKVLFVDKDRDTVTTLVRMDPGSRIPRHRHRGAEQCIVLQGDVSSGGYSMGPGDYNCSMSGSVHEELKSEGGALLFLVAPESYELLESSPT